MADLTDLKIFLAGLLRPIVTEAVREELHRIGNSTAPIPEEIGGIELAQQITRLSKARIYALVSARAIVHSKRGNRLFFRRSELEAWVAEGKREEVAA